MQDDAFARKECLLTELEERHEGVLCLFTADCSPFLPLFEEEFAKTGQTTGTQNVDIPVSPIKTTIAKIGQIVHYMSTFKFKIVRWSRPSTLSTSPMPPGWEIAKTTHKRRLEAQKPCEIHANLIVMK